MSDTASTLERIRALRAEADALEASLPPRERRYVPVELVRRVEERR